MRRVWRYRVAVMLDLRQILPGNIWPLRQTFARQRILDRQAILGGIAVVQAANPAIRGQAGVGGNPGAGDE